MLGITNRMLEERSMSLYGLVHPEDTGMLSMLHREGVNCLNFTQRNSFSTCHLCGLRRACAFADRFIVHVDASYSCARV